MGAPDRQSADWREILKRRSARWSLVSSVSSLGCVIIGNYLHGPLALPSVIIFGIAFLVSTVMFWRSSAGPYRTPSSITR